MRDNSCRVSLSSRRQPGGHHCQDQCRGQHCKIQPKRVHQTNWLRLHRVKPHISPLPEGNPANQRIAPPPTDGRLGHTGESPCLAEIASNVGQAVEWRSRQIRGADVRGLQQLAVVHPGCHVNRVREIGTGREGGCQPTAMPRHRCSTCGHRAPPGELTIPPVGYSPGRGSSVIIVTLGALFPAMAL